MDFAGLLDLQAAAIVGGGTLLATLLRSGRSEAKVTARVLMRLGKRRFDAKKVRAELSQQVREIQQDGLIRAHPHMFGDAEFDDATDAMIVTRSVDAFLARHAQHKARRAQIADTASRCLAQAAELAPVFGLAGTLVSLSQLPADGLARDAFAGAIAMAVLTTLYGLLLANLVLGPLARAVDRAIGREEAERQKLVDWLVGQVAGSIGPVPDQDGQQARGRHPARAA